MRHLPLGVTMIVLWVCSVAPARLQILAEPFVAFEVSSVKRNTTGSQQVSMGTTPGGYSATNASLRLLVLSAFGLRPAQIEAGPDWIDSERFDVVARAPAGTTRAAIMPMLRTLLAERFKLAARTEMRDQPIYALVLARSDGRLGPQLKPSATQCIPGRTANQCRISGTIGSTNGSVKGVGQTMAELAAYLGQNADRMVVDRTGQPERYDFELTWTANVLTADIAATPNEGTGLFTALQEQLGLKLESTRGPVPVLVIDHAALPSAD